MLLGIVLRAFITHSSTIVWIVNLLGIFLCFLPCFQKIRKPIGRDLLLFALISIITIILNIKYLTANLKAIGTNINILVLPLFLLIIDYVREDQVLSRSEIINLLHIISVIGIISILMAWILGSGNLIRVFIGRLSPYRADIDGFFYGKNIYGSFVSLTIAADLYLYKYSNRRVFVYIILAKVIAVILSFSRAALLHSLLLIFVFWWIEKKHKKRDYILLIAIVIGTILIFSSSSKVQSFVLNSVLRIEVGDAGRAYLRHRAITRAGVNFSTLVFGVGFAGIDFLHIDIDDTYYYLLFSGGILKILFYLYYLTNNMKAVVATKIRDKDLGNLCIAMIVSYLAFAAFESVALLELGLLNFLFTLFICIIPQSQRYQLE